MKNKKGLVLSALIGIFIIGVSIPLFMTKHKKLKAETISNLTGSTWLLNSTLIEYSDYYYYDTEFFINFNSNGNSYNIFEFYKNVDDNNFNDLIYSSNVYVYDFLNNTWSNQAYRTIEITGGTDVTNSSLISWLQNNATQIIVVQGTEITHKYWASYGNMIMTTNQVVGDNDITYTVLLNSYSDEYRDETLTGLAFTGILTNFDNKSYIISPPNEDILYENNTNTIDNPILLEFTIGDYIDSDLYDLMNDNGVWFDDARVYMAGTSFGSIYGFNTGRAYGQSEGLEYTNLITRIFNGLGNILSIQVFPHITIALIIGLPLLLGVFIIIIKILRG